MKNLLDDPDMDAQLGRTLITAAAEGADLGEALAAAGRVTLGDYDSWWDEWSATARVAQSAGDTALNGGHTVTARKAFLRASEYWRQALFFIRHDLDDPRLQQGWHQHRSTFRAAVPLLDGDTVVDEIPFDGVSMTAYLFRPAHDGAVRPTVIVPCGFDSTAEAGYLFTAYMALARGYNCFVFEGPGQGGMLYEHRRPMRPDFEVPFAAAFAWLLRQEGVDATATALVGRSLGGYLAPRAAAFEPRIAALVCDPGQYDFVARIQAMFPGEKFQKLIDADPELDAGLEKLLDGPRNIEYYGARKATLGGETMGDFIRNQLTHTLEGVVSNITCATLLTEGEGDFAAQGEALYGQLRGYKEFKKFTAAEGAGGHCEGLGATLWEGYVFDWLDEVLGKAG